MIQERRIKGGSGGRFSTLGIVDSLAEITRFKDRELLERSLAATLAEIFPAEEFRFYRITLTESESESESDLRISLLMYAQKGAIVSDAHHLDHEVPQWLLAAMTEAVEKQDLVERHDASSGVTHLVYPVYGKRNDIYGALLHGSIAPTFDSKRLVYGLLRIYSNYLALLEESHRDTLTNLLNREILDTEITKIIASHVHGNDHHEQQRRALDGYHAWLCMIDVDFFKRINDEWGHLYGDEVLILLARQLETIFRKEDLLFRYGGEEFVVIFRTFSREDADAVCERARATIAAHPFPGVGQVTVSIGCAEIDRQPGASIVIGQADKALYYAKEHGRNQSRFYEQLVTEGLVEERSTHQASVVDYF